MEKIAALLIAAHSLGDFALQPDWMIQRKRQWPFLLLHGALHAAIALLVLQAWAC
jgi:hypothetical protein